MCALNALDRYSMNYTKITNPSTKRTNYSNTYTTKQVSAPNKSKNSTIATVATAAVIIVGAIILRKPIGKALAPVLNTLKSKFPTLANTLKAVGGRAGRSASRAKDKVAPKVVNAAKDIAGFVKNKALPSTKHAVQDVADFSKNKVLPTAKHAVQDVADFSKNKVLPTTKHAAQDVVEFTKDKVVPNTTKTAKKTAGIITDTTKTTAKAVSGFTKNKALPKVKQFLNHIKNETLPRIANANKKFLNFIAEKANSDLPKA